MPHRIGSELPVIDVWRPAGSAPALPQNQLHLWRIAAIPSEAADALAFMLPPDERQRASQLRMDSHRRRYLIIQTALRGILAQYLMIRPQRIVIERGAQGKPYIAGGSPPLAFNLTTSDDVALLAITRDQEIGIDCELIRPRSQMLSIARRLFSHEDGVQLEQAAEPERLLRFYALWTRLEARVKATGYGLYVNRAISMETAVHAETFVPAPGFVATVASTHPLPVVAAWTTLQWSPQDT